MACRSCARLVTFLEDARAAHPGYHCAPVPGFGDPEARLLIVGLAPGMHGANRHGRVFTGDAAGAWLWAALHRLGLAARAESVAAGDDQALTGVYITNAVRCAPPANRPTSGEIRSCAGFLEREVGLLPRLRCALALGRIAHQATARALGAPRLPFGHGAAHRLEGRVCWLADSYHPSRQNTNTARLTWAAWTEAVAQAWRLAGGK